MLPIAESTFDGIAGTSTYYVVGPDSRGRYKTFNGLLRGGFLFPRLRARLYALVHR